MKSRAALAPSTSKRRSGLEYFSVSPHVVEHGAQIEQLGIVFQPATLAGQRAPEEHAAAVVVEQVVLGIAEELGGGAGDGTVRHADAGDDLGHAIYLLHLGSLRGGVNRHAVVADGG